MPKMVRIGDVLDYGNGLRDWVPCVAIETGDEVACRTEHGGGISSETGCAIVVRHIADIICGAMQFLQPVRVGDVWNDVNGVSLYPPLACLLCRGGRGWEARATDGSKIYATPALREYAGHVSDFLASGLRAVSEKPEHWAASEILEFERALGAAIRSRVGIHGEYVFRSGDHSYPDPVTMVLQGVQPHESSCSCILCSLPRGPGWGEEELRRRVDSIGRDVHASFYALRTWVAGARSRFDKRECPE